MVKNKLKRLKRAEENKILKEHEGLYNRLIAENFPVAEDVSIQPEPKPRAWPRRGVLAVASMALASVIIVGSGVLILGGGFNKKNDAAHAPNADFAASEVTLSTVESELDYTSLNMSSVNVKKISAVGANDYFEIEVDTFHTFDLIVKVNPNCDVPEAIKPGANAMHKVNSHGFEVDYTVTRRRMEDYFMFNTKAVVKTGSEVYYIRYNYSSSNATCELLDVIEAFITPKQ